MDDRTSNQVVISRETLASVRAARVEDLLVRHWEEIAHYKDIPLEVHWPTYEAAEAVGGLRIFTARVNGELVGYACLRVHYNPHYCSSLQALQDVLFLAPEYRNARIGRQLVAYADASVASEGVQVTYQHSKVRQPIDALLERQGYELVERIWAKRHDRG